MSKARLSHWNKTCAKAGLLAALHLMRHDALLISFIAFKSTEHERTILIRCLLVVTGFFAKLVVTGFRSYAVSACNVCPAGLILSSVT